MRLMPILFVTFLLFAFYGTDRVWGQEPIRMPVAVAPVICPNCVPVVPQALYQPQIQLVPYQYQRTEVMPRDYRTPLRDLFLGRYRINHYYTPQVQR